MTTAPKMTGGAHGVRPRKPRRGRLVALVLAVLLLIGGAGGAGWWFTTGQYVAAPDLVSQPRQVAAEAATAAHLETRWDEAFSETVPPGSVVATDPAPGARVQRNGTLTIVVSKGPERYAMPEVVGKPVDQVRNALGQTHLVIGALTEDFDDAAAPGTVIRSSVNPGTMLKRDDRIDLVVSKGPRPIDIPSYVGKSADDAEAALKKAGFKVDVRTENSKTVPVGRVIAQTPDRGAGKKGDTVSLVRSLGPVMVAVPQTRAMGVKEATDVLKKSGFQVATKQSGTYLGLGYVAYSEVEGGQKAPEGSTITLYLV